jgi:hypothetical protein
MRNVIPAAKRRKNVAQGASPWGGKVKISKLRRSERIATTYSEETGSLIAPSQPDTITLTSTSKPEILFLYALVL